jgi:hypothetical protein
MRSWSLPKLPRQREYRERGLVGRQRSKRLKSENNTHNTGILPFSHMEAHITNNIWLIDKCIWLYSLGTKPYTLAALSIIGSRLDILPSQ